MNHLRSSSLLTALLLVGAIGWASTASAANVSGALFTTTMNGTRVNANIYSAKCGVDGVWIDGGPGPNAPQTAAGLDDGDYYFQVTDPSGKTLLSTDAVKNRQFRVSGGIIVSLSGAGNHNTALDNDHGATTIELCPYLDTPNPGGVYKAWITPVGSFNGDPNKVDNRCSNGCFHGFVASQSKTDNFKVKGGAAAACLEVLKVYDIDGNGNGDIGVDPLIAWPVTIVDPLGSSNTFYTGYEKECTFAQLVPGLYTLVEGTVPGWHLTFNIIDGAYARTPDEAVLVRIKNNSTREVVYGNTDAQ